MLTWLAQNTATIMICAVLIAVVAAIIIHMIKNKKKGKSACGCGCADCPMRSACHKQR
ncbi:MAG: FeoB-associated Cys-rich membrane protein [Candidatus Fimenecus sp.]